MESTDCIVVRYKDGSKFDINKVVSVIWVDDSLLITLIDCNNEVWTKSIKGKEIRNYTVERGEH